MDDTKYGIDKSWLDAGLDISLIDDVMHVISQKRQSRTILPAHNDVLNALKLTPFSDVKVLIIGQDPYPSAEHAHGLAFSSLSPKTPASLKNIFKKLENDFPNAEHKSNLLFTDLQFIIYYQHSIKSAVFLWNSPQNGEAQQDFKYQAHHCP